MNNRKSIAILFVFVMLLQPLMTPTGELNQKNTLEVDARSTLPDVMVVDVTTILGGGVFSSGTNKLAIGTHQVSVNITNQGVTTAQSTLMVNYVPLGAPAVNVATVTVDLNPFEFETHTREELYYNKEKLLDNGDKWESILAANIKADKPYR